MARTILPGLRWMREIRSPADRRDERRGPLTGSLPTSLDGNLFITLFPVVQWRGVDKNETDQVHRGREPAGALGPKGFHPRRDYDRGADHRHPARHRRAQLHQGPRDLALE